MPTTYTHDIFGKDVFRRLPENLKDVIRRGKGVYRIGLHGPDIFFYYRPVSSNRINQIGHRMHREEAAGFFEQGIREFRENPSVQLAAYLMGFACHFMLDSTCHGYINAFEAEKGVSHAEIETELDRYYLLRERKELFRYLPAGVLEPTWKNCQVIARMFPEVTEKQIQKAVKSQKYYDALLTCRGKAKEQIILNGMKVLGCYKEMEGQVMRKSGNPVCEASTAKLAQLYQQALEDTPRILENLYDCFYRDGVLSPRFQRNYNGDENG